MIKVKDHIAKRDKFKNDIKYAQKVASSDLNELKRMHKLKLEDKWNNQFHLSAYSGLINDPNGLTKFDGKYHTFYQWAPFSPVHTLKHWGHFVTSDFINYTHTGLALEPSLKEDANGTFSGGALSEKNKLYTYWTGNIKPFNSKDEDRSAFTLVGEWSDKENKIINKRPLFEVDKSKYTGHFRDPKPLKINHKFYLLHGAQSKIKNGELVLYESNHPNKDFKLLGNIKINPELKNFGYMWECPDYIDIDQKEFLIFSPQGISFFGDKNENKDTVIFLEGKFNLKDLTFDATKKPQIIDHGFDFYAPQTFTRTKRNLLIGWAGAGVAESYATFKHGWAHNLTLTRELSLSDDDYVLQNPIKEYENLREREVSLEDFNHNESRLAELNIDFRFDKKTIIKLSNEFNESVEITFKNNHFTFSRANMTFEQGPEFGLNRTREHRKEFKNAKIYIDNSLIEIYANNGEFVFTSKYFLRGKLKLEVINSKNNKFYLLKPFNIIWNI